jgi:hypothetical protein
MAEREGAVLKELTRLEHEEIAQSQQYPGAPYWKMAARFGQMELEGAPALGGRDVGRIAQDTRNKRSEAETRKEKNMQASEVVAMPTSE